METTTKRRNGKKRDWVKKVDIPRECAVLKGTARVDYLVSPYGEVFGHDLRYDTYYRISKWKDNRHLYCADGTKVTIPTEYLRVAIHICGVEKSPFVHRLVALFFCRNDDPVHKTQVDHIDGNPANNDYTNLEWVTKEENNHRKCKARGWKPYSEAKKARCREGLRRAIEAHRLRKLHLQESNLFNE